MDQNSYDVVNVGSIVQDFISYAPRFPTPGETVRGEKFVFNFGGKGANQAVIASRLGARTAMVGKVGQDVFGKALIDNFHTNGVNADHVSTTDQTSTGAAAITIDDSGQNSIAVCVGANLLLTAEDVRRAEPILSRAKVVVCQLEVKEEASLETLKIAKKHGVTTIFNPAPDPPNGIQDQQFYRNADIICPNEHEAECLAQFPMKTAKDVDRALALFLERGAKVAIITLGKRGCAFATVDNPNPVRLSAPVVKAVDTVGAGDAFVGSLSYFTACRSDLPLEERIRRSLHIASISVQAAGIPLDLIAESKMVDVVVVGSCAQDLFSYVPRFPGPGQDVMGTRFALGFGGKGANQAVTAARLGAKTAMIAKVGKDMFGQPTIDNLRSNGINTDHVHQTDKASTGTANILVDESGQNSIVVVLGANSILSVDDIGAAEKTIANAKVVVCQLEVNEAVTLETLRLAKKHGVTTIFNPAPAPPGGLADNEFFKRSDVVCPNETEAELLAGFALRTDDDIRRALSTFLQRGAKTAIITLGARGCAFASGTSDITWVPSPKVDAADTTGAGDAFVGSLAFYMAHHANLSMEERIRRCCRISAIAVQSPGTQTSYPAREKLPGDLFD